MTDELQQKIRQVPVKPGVYLFKNKKGEIIYIGKAKNLRNRVRSYFQSNRHQRAKTVSMVRQIDKLEWIVVRNEVEALLTEANMIKEYRPHYNLDLKDDKSFPFIRVTMEPYPQVFITRTIVRDGSKYYGPYTDVRLLRHTMAAVHKVFPLRSCNYYLDDEVIAAGKVSLCLDYHIKKCEGPCAGQVSEKDYNAMVTNVIAFLQGDTAETEEYVKLKMGQAAGDLRFEDAAHFRDQLNAIESFKARQRKVVADFTDRDVVGFARQEDLGLVSVIRIRQGRIFARERFRLRNLGEADDRTLQHFITRFYLEGDFLPQEVLLPFEPENGRELVAWLSEKRGKVVKFLVPKRGEKAHLLDMATSNAKLLLSDWVVEKMQRREFVPSSVRQLQEEFQMAAPPRRIEAFDISHLGGTNTVASLVCFVDGKARKKDYRKFNIKTAKGIDDFAAMREVVLRRYKRLQNEKKALPDLVLIDGGKGQLGMAVSALRELGLDYLTVVGLAKRLEEVYRPGISNPQSIPKTSPGLILLRRIRDEAHRFAITFQRKKREKAATESIFSGIAGIGPKRLRKLQEAYPDVEAISNEDIDALMLRTGFNAELSKDVIKVAQQFISKKNAGNPTRAG